MRRLSRLRRIWAWTLVSAAAVLLAGILTTAPASAASTTLRTGFMDDSVLALPAPARAGWLDDATSVGASVMRVNMHWNLVAPTAPPVEAATDPTWAGYDFTQIDGEIKAALAAHMSVLLNVGRAPAWAEGPGKPKNVGAGVGSWKPSAGAYGQFMSAVAKRYSGSTPDPAAPGQMLPRVQQFQLWNEPNLNLYLAPQYENNQPYAPLLFRQLVNVGYDAIKAVQPTATVVAAGLAPYGDPGTKGQRTRPVAFLRSMLCVNAALQKVCNDPTRVDAFSLHPYAVAAPSRSALDGDDATIPNVNRLTTVLRHARAAGTVGPKLPPVWVTEVSYDSSPPDPAGVPTAKRALYISETMWRLWRAGVSTVVWYLMRDDAPTPSYAATYQSGIFLRSGKRKGDARAFRFPLMVTSKTSTKLRVWLRTPFAGSVRLQVQKHGRWTTARRVTLKLDGVDSTVVPRAGVTAVRAIAGKATSYPWPVK